MNDQRDRLRSVGAEPAQPNRHGPVSRAAFLAELAGRRAAARQARAAELLAARRGEIISMFLDAVPLARKEQIIGAGYARLGEMTDVEFGAYSVRVQIALGGDGE